MSDVEELKQRVERLEGLAKSIRDGVLGTETLIAGAYHLFDGKGRRRAELGMNGDVAALVERDGEGRARAMLAVYPDGRPHLQLRDKDGKVRLGMGLEADGSPAVHLADAAGTPRITMTERAGSPQIVVTDKEGRPRAVIIVEADGTPRIMRVGEDGHELVDGPGVVAEPVDDDEPAPKA